MRRFRTLLIAALLSMSVTVPGFADDKALAGRPAETTTATAKQEPLDINTASEADLKALSGIGDANAKKIIAGRPYTRKDQLLSRKIVPKATYDKIKDKIVAKQAKK